MSASAVSTSAESSLRSGREVLASDRRGSTANVRRSSMACVGGEAISFVHKFVDGRLWLHRCPLPFDVASPSVRQLCRRPSAGKTSAAASPFGKTLKPGDVCFCPGTVRRCHFQQSLSLGVKPAAAVETLFGRRCNFPQPMTPCVLIAHDPPFFLSGNMTFPPPAIVVFAVTGTGKNLSRVGQASVEAVPNAITPFPCCRCG